MNSFSKDLIGIVFLFSWVLPTLAVTGHLVFTRVLAVWRSVRQSMPATRKVRVRALTERTISRVAISDSTPTAQANIRVPRPRLGDRWKSSQRVTAGLC